MVADDRAGTRTTWVVDAYNVIGARPDGWWRNRMLALAALCDTVAAWRSDRDDVIVMVDGWPHAEVPEGRRGGLEVRYAHRRGPDGADHAIVELLRSMHGTAQTTVVTSDVRLREEATGLGAAVVGAGAFQRSLDAWRPDGHGPDTPSAPGRRRGG